MPSRSTTSGIDMFAEIAGTTRRISYGVSGATLEPSVNAAIATMLLPAMRTGGSLSADEEASPRLLGSLPTIQAIFRNWEQRFAIYKNYQTVRIDIRPLAQAEPRPGRRTATFFSGGVDSFYTLHRHRSEIDRLVFVDGFDIRPRDHALGARVTDAMRAAAAAWDLPLIEIQTNLRSVTDQYANWIQYHGSALAGVALLLAAEIERVFIPASLTYAYLSPLGSHPLLDPLWSTEWTEIVHDGCEASRIDKLAALVDEPTARQHLRVCWENRDGRYNCGSCEKCLRTMIALQAIGALGAFTTFPDAIDPADVARVELPELRYTWENSLQLLKQTGRDRALVRALDRRLYGPGARVINYGRRGGRRLRSAISLLNPSNRGWQ
jgi:hypothetical protein